MKETVSVVGLGYVGLPLAVELAKYYEVTGFDINEERINKLQAHEDPNGEVARDDLAQSSLVFSAQPEVISDANYVVVAVPTPIDAHNNPDLRPVLGASHAVGQHMKQGATVIYESTVYPGVTEDECVPVLEQSSGMKWKEDFFVGYSPERINPGDKVHTFATIVKVVAGDTPQTQHRVAELYARAVTAGVHKAPSIKAAEAAKVIENTQRDINIALMNELRIIFDKMDISTRAVLEAAGTKWNFLPFSPGLVGGHCIGVDPYYLAYKAEEIGHHPQLILAGRRINDAMGRYFARNVVKMLIEKKVQIYGSRVLVCGITFKENVPDIRNSRVIDIIRELQSFHMDVDVWDPVAYPEDVRREYDMELVDAPAEGAYDAVILTVTHTAFVEAGPACLRRLAAGSGIFFDVKQAMEQG